MDFRCFTLHFYFKIKNSELFNYEDGYATTTAGECTNANNMTVEQFNTMAGGYQKLLAKQCEVDIKDVIQITRDEYKANTEEEEDE